MCVIRFGGEEAEYLAVTIHGRNIPAATDYWDGNFLRCTAEVSAGAFRGSVSNLLRNEDLARFLARVEDLYQRLEGEALFDTLDGWLDLRLIGDGQGHIEVRAVLCDDPVHGNTLEFQLHFDQSFLPALMEQLRTALEQFPVLGQRLA